MRILLVDDDRTVRLAVAASLRRHLEIELAEGADDAIARLEGGAFDAIVSDFDMPPGENGVWLLGEAERRWPNVRRFLTSGAPVRGIEGLLGSTVEAFFDKPIRAADLLEALRAAAASAK